MDDTQKIQSIRTVKGFLTDVYFEEAFEIEDYEAFRKIRKNDKTRRNLKNGKRNEKNG